MLNSQSVSNRMNKKIIKYGIVLQPVVAARHAASEKSELVTQYLFGDILSIGEEDRGFLFVTSLYDNYSGWVWSASIEIIDCLDILQFKTPFISTAQLADVFNLSDRSIIRLPLGSRLINYNQSNGRFGIPGHEYQIHPSYVVNVQPASLNGISETAFSFRNSPYLWGGKTTLGIDCSGFVQLVYAIHGYNLPRDAKDQMQIGELIESLDKAMQGDLLFFSSMDSSEISHVGILIDKDRVIHASVNVHTDFLVENSICCTKTGLRSHVLRAIRRIGV